MSHKTKYIRVFLFSFLLLFLFALPLHAESSDIKVFVDNKAVNFDVKPYIDKQARTMVPLRFVSEELGYEVNWNSTAKEVSVKGSNISINLWIGNTTAQVNGNNVSLDTSCALQEGRTMVPLRFIVENIGAKVDYQASSKSIYIATANSGVNDGKDGQPVPIEGQYVVVTGSVVNLRKGPGTDYEILSKASKGDSYNIVAKSGNWYQLALGNNVDQKGWIISDYVTIKNGDASEGTGGNPTSPKELVNINDFQVIDNGREIGFKISSDTELTYKTQRMENPSRLVIDFPGAVFYDREVSENISVNHELISAIRYAQFSQDQFRVVIDLNAAAGIEEVIKEYSNRELTFKIGKPSLKGKTIIIDPGHGVMKGTAYDPGAVGQNGLREVDVVMDIGKKVETLLIQKGATVYLTRDGKLTELTLAGRAKMADQKNADIFVSIHANANTNRAVGGTSTYTYTSGNFAQGKSERNRLAWAVQNALVAELGLRNIGVLEGNFAVLKNSQVPSILVETAFISNANEEKLLGDANFRTKIAEGIVKGLENYFMK